MPTRPAVDPSARFKSRRQKAWRMAGQLVKKENKKATLDALFITNNHDIHYLTGLHEGAACLLMGPGWAILGVHKMFQDVAPPMAPGTDVEVIINEYDWVNDILRKHKARRIGFEGHSLSFARHKALTDKLPVTRKLIPLPPLVIEVRAVKDEEEIKITQKAVRIAERAFQEMIAEGSGHLIGRTEFAIATELETRMKELGAAKQGFTSNGIIVAAGPNSASCHHVPSKRKIKVGEPLLIDWGAEVDNYRSDITRVIYPVKPPAWIENIHNTVEQALFDCTKAIKPRVATSQLHQLSVDIIKAAGHGEHYPHSLGHGLGLEIHEAPRLSHKVKDKLKSNMIITIEPGIYLHEKGGVRLENDVLVTDSGYKVMNKLPTSLEKSVIE